MSETGWRAASHPVDGQAAHEERADVARGAAHGPGRARPRPSCTAAGARWRRRAGAASCEPRPTPRTRRSRAPPSRRCSPPGCPRRLPPRAAAARRSATRASPPARRVVASSLSCRWSARLTSIPRPLRQTSTVRVMTSGGRSPGLERTRSARAGQSGVRVSHCPGIRPCARRVALQTRPSAFAAAGTSGTERRTDRAPSPYRCGRRRRCHARTR